MRSFFDDDRATLTVMVQAKTPARIRELIDLSARDGAEAFGMQFEQLEPEYRCRETYKELFAYTGDKPVYATNYRGCKNEGKSDDVLAEELLELAECGADLCDVIGDLYDKQEDELSREPAAIEKQMKLIERIHATGAKVLMSSHVMKFTSAERVLEIALEQKRRGADIAKIVTGADSIEEEIENLRIIELLRQKLGIPFLFLCGGECALMRRIGGELGCTMYLCVYEHDELATAVQPLLKNVKAIRDNMA